MRDQSGEGTHAEAEFALIRRDIAAANDKIGASEAEQKRDRAVRTEISPFAPFLDPQIRPQVEKSDLACGVAGVTI